MAEQLRGLFEKLADWQQYATVTQRKAVIAMPSFSGGSKVVVA